MRYALSPSSATIRNVAVDEQRQVVVLLAEDDVVLRNIIRLTLERAGFRVLAAADGIEALTFSRKYCNRIDILLTDVDMPKLDGISLAEHVKKQRPETLVLVMSGRWRSVVRVYDVDVKLLPKPFSPEILLETIRNLLELR